tara:strand:+ start:920 stop:1462 length:543 start_codon:yes stop_codon:yes gene_type:complete
MILSDVTLKNLIESKELIVDPIEEGAIQPGSIDCRLGTTFLTVSEKNKQPLSLSKEVIYEKVEGDLMTIPAHSFLLATTQEYIKLPNNITAFVEGRSSVGRIGLFIQNAGWVDAGFEGRITLELFNASPLPIQLEAGRRICQLVFCFMDKNADKPYSGKYLRQTSTVGSRIHNDYDVTPH